MVPVRKLELDARTVIHLRSIRRRAGDDAPSGFPFSVPTIRAIETLEFDEPVTFFVGANGSGKSTLLEAIAAAARLPSIGSAEVDRDPTLAAQRQLASAFRLVWTKRATRGFFLRAEDFFGFARRIARLRAELEQDLGVIGEEYKDRSDYARTLALGPVRGSLAELTRRYGQDVDARSHGESFIQLFRSRFVPGGLFLLDEPEAALSPQSQLGLLSLLKEMVGEDGQFIIATHSPILLAFPNARIFDFDSVPIRQATWDELEHVSLTRAFLADPERYLRHL